MISTIKIQHVIVAALALVFAATAPDTHAQAAVPAVEETVVGSGVKETVATPTLDAAVKMEIRRQNDELRNELRRQYLDDRAESLTWWAKKINWWLAGVAILFTALGVVLTLSFRHKAHEAIKKAQESADKASDVATKASELVKTIERHEKQAEKGKQSIEVYEQKSKESMRAILEKASDDMADSVKIEQPEESVENVREFPEVSKLEKKMDQAHELRKSGETEKAIKEYLDTANSAKEIDKKITASAWLWVGYLEKDLDKEIRAYSEAIHHDPTNSVTYNNRGIAKTKLGRHQDAIDDYYEAIRLDRNRAIFYHHRGNSKRELERYHAAIEDYDEAIRLNEKHMMAYLDRSLAKLGLGPIEDVLSDLRTALKLAEESEYKGWVTTIADIIRQIEDDEKNKQKST